MEQENDDDGNDNDALDEREHTHGKIEQRWIFGSSIIVIVEMKNVELVEYNTNLRIQWKPWAL